MIPDRLHNTVSFLGLFSKVDGLKYLTHVFDSASGDDFLEHVTRCSLELSKVKDLIKKIAERIITTLQKKLEKLISFFKNTFVKRFSISYAKRIGSELKKIFS